MGLSEKEQTKNNNKKNRHKQEQQRAVDEGVYIFLFLVFNCASCRTSGNFKVLAKSQMCIRPVLLISSTVPQHPLFFLLLLWATRAARVELSFC